MIRPGPRNLITDVDGILVGNAEDENAQSGVTVVLAEEPALVAVEVQGGAPATRETDALDPSCLVDRVDAIALSGGSVFGLESAGGVASWLVRQGRGFVYGAIRVPVVPAAALFDLTHGGDKDWGDTPPYRSLGVAATGAAGRDFALGNAGAGLGAIAGKLKGGLGSVSALSDDGVQVGAIIAVNSFGSLTMPGSPTMWAWALEQEGELGGQPLPTHPAGRGFDFEGTLELHIGTNTTIGVVATNVDLDKAQARRLALMAHDGLARAISPVHMPFEGDTLFALSTGRVPLAEPVPPALGRLGMMAADCVARAAARAVYEAESLGDVPSYRSLHAGALAGA